MTEVCSPTVRACGATFRPKPKPHDWPDCATLTDSRRSKCVSARLRATTAMPRRGRTEKLIPAVRRAAGAEVRLLADGNSCYTPPTAIEAGRRMEDQDYF